MTSSTTSGPAFPISSARRTYTLGLLLVIYISACVDRQIVTILAEPIKTDLGLADWQLGLLTGLAFSLFYTLFGIPLARLADRTNRSRLIAVSLILWSGFTAMCATAQGFTQLLLLRLGVGVGEAGCGPASQSLITDYVPPERRAFAMSIFAAGLPIGSLLGLVIGGLVASSWGWRTAFLIVGMPGLLLAAVAFFTLRDPRHDQHRTAAGAIDRFADAFRLLRPKRSYWLIVIGISANVFTAASIQSFGAPFFLRNHGDDLARMAQGLSGLLGLHLAPIGFLGLALGLSYGLAGACGMVFGGMLADRLGRQDPRGYLTVPAFAMVLTVPFGCAALLVDDGSTALILWGMAAMCFNLPIGVMYAAAQTIAPPPTRALAASIQLFALNFFGAGFGPLLTGALSDILNREGALDSGTGIRWALCACCFMTLVAAAFYWRARQFIKADSLN